MESVVNFLTRQETLDFLQKYGVPVAIAVIIVAIVSEIIKALPVLFTPENIKDPEYFITLENAEKLRKRCKRLNFSAIPEFWEADVHELQACNNGVGPSKWSPKFRKFIAKALNSLDCSLLIHDYEWENCDKTFFSFLMINAKLIMNSIREARDRKDRKMVALGLSLAFINIFLGWKLFKGDIL